jgi:hypothetical protein
MEESDEESEEDEENTDSPAEKSPANPKTLSAEKLDSPHSVVMSAKLDISDFTRQMEEVTLASWIVLIRFRS